MESFNKLWSWLVGKKSSKKIGSYLISTEEIIKESNSDLKLEKSHKESNSKVIKTFLEFTEDETYKKTETIEKTEKTGIKISKTTTTKESFSPEKFFNWDKHKSFILGTVSCFIISSSLLWLGGKFSINEKISWNIETDLKTSCTNEGCIQSLTSDKRQLEFQVIDKEGVAFQDALIQTNIFGKAIENFAPIEIPEGFSGQKELYFKIFSNAKWPNGYFKGSIANTFKEKTYSIVRIQLDSSKNAGFNNLVLAKDVLNRVLSLISLVSFITLIIYFPLLMVGISLTDIKDHLKSIIESAANNKVTPPSVASEAKEDKPPVPPFSFRISNSVRAIATLGILFIPAYYVTDTLTGDITPNLRRKNVSTVPTESFGSRGSKPEPTDDPNTKGQTMKHEIKLLEPINARLENSEKLVSLLTGLQASNANLNDKVGMSVGAINSAVASLKTETESNNKSIKDLYMKIDSGLSGLDNKGIKKSYLDIVASYLSESNKKMEELKNQIDISTDEITAKMKK